VTFKKILIIYQSRISSETVSLGMKLNINNTSMRRSGGMEEIADIGFNPT